MLKELKLVHFFATSFVGPSHELMPLEPLVDFLRKQINELKPEMLNKEEKLEKLFKLSSKSISDYDDETSAMIERLHTTRDDQVYHFTYLLYSCWYQKGYLLNEFLLLICLPPPCAHLVPT